jgi:hypothetical protein
MAVAAAAVACADNKEVPTEAVSAQSAVTNQATPEPLFTLVMVPVLTKDQDGLLSRIRARESSAEVYVVRLNSAPHPLLQIGKAVLFPLAPTAQVVALGERLVERSADDLSWAGAIPNNSGSIQLVLTTKGVTASIRTLTALYRIEPIGDGLHAVIRVGNLPPEHPPGAPSGAIEAFTGSPSGTSVAASAVPARFQLGASDVRAAQSALSSQSIRIDVLVAYTPSAAAASGDINGLIQLAFDESNTSYSNSGINLTIAPAYVGQVDYTEAGRTYFQHVAALQSPSDGIMDIVHTWRDQYLADVVVLIVNDQSYCGLASAVLANASTAFAAVDYTCATGNYSFGHEIGHLQGARHDRTSDSTNTPFQYGHGYIEPNHQWRTIMAYPQPCDYCLRTQYWSNPNVTYPPTGQVMGTTAYEYDASVLDQTKYSVGLFRGLPTYIYGPSWMSSSNQCYFTAYAFNGTAPYQYSWSYSLRNGASGGGYSPSNDTFFLVAENNLGQVYLTETVTDANGSQGTSTHVVNFGSGNCS